MNEDEEKSLLALARFLFIAVSSACIALIFSGGKKKNLSKKSKKKKGFRHFYSKSYNFLNGVADTAAVKLVERDVRLHPEKFIPKDKGLTIETAEIIDI